MTEPFPIESYRLGACLLTVPARGGPRILQLTLADGRALLAETPQASWETPFGTFHLRGGHRLWHAPEAFPRSYIPDDDGPAPLFDGTRLELNGAVEPTGLRKQICVEALGPQRLRLTHTLFNEGLWPIRCAPWAITQLRPGGRAVLPLRSANRPALLPDRTIRLWPYLSVNDRRLHWFDDLIGLDTAEDGPPAKLGVLTDADWAAYLSDDVLFCKQGLPATAAEFPHGCNLELYCDPGCVELETLAPLAVLAPGARLSHSEYWTIATRVSATSFDTIHHAAQELTAGHAND